MNADHSHIIEKVFFEVNTRSSKKAHLIKSNIDLLIKNELFPRLEKLFDKYDNPNKTVRFNTFDINISVDDLDKTDILNSEFDRKVSEKLKIELGIIKPENIGESDSGELNQISAEQNREATFLFFLKNGYLPWYGKEEYVTEFTKNNNWKIILNNEDFRLKLERALKSEDSVVERFILQFPIDNIFSFVEKSNHLFAENKKQFMKVFGVLRDNLRVSFLKFLVYVSLFDKRKKWMPILKKFYSTIYENEKQLNRFAGFPFVSQFKEVIQKIVSEKGMTDFIAFEHRLIPKSNTEPVLVSESSDIQVEEEEVEQRFIENELTEIAIQNAGLIILHPFIKRFFERLDLLDTDCLVKKDKLVVAVQSLHYLATGDEFFFEGSVIFEKYLCGVLLKMPIPIKNMLTEVIKVEVINLLNEAIKNWPALKNTSPDGLRQMFIQRDGKLIKSDNSCKLIIERKAQDVLLEKLNWNISIVKLPWKKELLFIEW